MPSDHSTINRNKKTTQVTIPSSSATSGNVNNGAFAIAGFALPANFLGTSVTFTVSPDGTTFYPAKDQYNTAISVAVSASSAYNIPTDVVIWPFFRIVSSVTETNAPIIQILRMA